MSLEVYPLYGYHATNHICQIKQASEQSEINETLSGEYWSIGECRSANPEILLFTGQGIFWWTILVAACVAKFALIAKKKNVSFASVKGECAFELVLGSIALGIVFLAVNYFSVSGDGVITSDVNSVISEYVVHRRYASVLTLLYIAISAIQVFFATRNTEKR